MKVTPMLLRPDMARAWAEDRKGRTQRLITRLKGFGPITEFGRSDTPGYDWHFRDKRMRWHDITTERLMELCPYGGPGDRLQLLTTWAVPLEHDKTKPSDLPRYLKFEDSIWTYFDGPKKPEWIGRVWYGRLRPGRFMPQWMRELMPAPKNISIEPRQIQDITDKECLEEGIKPYDVAARGYQDARVAFRVLWDSIHPPIIEGPLPRPGYPWSANPWEWNIRFQKRSEI